MTFCPYIKLTYVIMSEAKNFFLNELFHQHAGEISSFILGRWPREQDVADIVQDPFLCLAQYPNLEEIRNPRAFLFKTASNMVVDRQRRRNTRERYNKPEADVETVADRQLSPDRYWEAHEALAHFAQWLDELPELQRHAFVLFRIEGCSHAEIALRLGISISSSERYVRVAMQHISKRLSAATV